MKPTVGRIVHYHPNEAAAKLLRDRAGGNSVEPFEPVAAVIVRAWGDQETSAVNLKVLTDGPTDVWISSVTGTVDTALARDTGVSYWTWPPRI